MFKRLLTLPLEEQRSIFLFGPRGTGKTSYIKTTLPDALYFDLLKFSTYKSLSIKPDRLEKLIPKDYKDWIVIDEIQRVPELLNEVHRLIELYKYRFILTGSSARSLRRKGVNLLGGRASNYYIHPLIVQEIGDTFNLAHALKYGLLPTAVTINDPEEYLGGYIENYIREEVLQEGLIRDIGVFSHFLEAASFSQGQPLNFSVIARQVAINRATASEYFTILEDLLLGVKLVCFKKRAKREVIAHDKFYFFDAGVYRYLKPEGPADTPQEGDGAALETVFLQSARAINDYFKLKYTIYFWRTTSSIEVDFILYGPGGIHAFEIKRSDEVDTRALKGLKAFHEEYPEAKLYFLYMGDHKEYHGNITAIPFEQALKELPQLLGYELPKQLSGNSG